MAPWNFTREGIDHDSRSGRPIKGAILLILPASWIVGTNSAPMDYPESPTPIGPNDIRLISFRGARKSPRPRDQSLSAAAPAQSGGLVGVGPGRPQRGEAEQQADPAVDRLCGLSLVPCHGAGKLRGCADRGGDE